MTEPSPASSKELWLGFIDSWRQEAEERGSRAAQTYGKAYKSLKASPFTYSHPCQTIEVSGIGKTIIERLEKDLAAWCRAQGEVMPSRMGEIKEIPKKPRGRQPGGGVAGGAKKKANANANAVAGPSKASNRPMTAAQKALERIPGRPNIVPVDDLAFEDMGAEDDFAHLNQGPNRQKAPEKRRAKDDEPADSPPRKVRKKSTATYIPHKRTGGYGILLGLYDRALAMGGAWEDAISKAEVIKYAQPFCDSDYTTASMGTKVAATALVGPGAAREQRNSVGASNVKNFYTAWNSMKTLIDKGYIWQTGSPPRFCLTQPGYVVARSIAEQERIAPAADEGGPGRGLRPNNRSSDLSDDISSSPPRMPATNTSRRPDNTPPAAQLPPQPPARRTLILPPREGPSGPLASTIPFLYVYLTKDPVPRRVLRKSASKLSLDKDMVAAHYIEFPKRLKKHRMVKGSAVQRVTDVARGDESVPGDEGTADEFREPMCRGWIRTTAGDSEAPGLSLQIEVDGTKQPESAIAPSSSSNSAEQDFALPATLLNATTAPKKATLVLPPKDGKETVVISIDDSDSDGEESRSKITSQPVESSVISDSDDDLPDIREVFAAARKINDDAPAIAAAAAFRRTQSTALPVASSSTLPPQRTKSAPNAPLRPRLSDFVPNRGIESTYHRDIAPIGSSSSSSTTVAGVNTSGEPSALGGTNLHAALDSNPSNNWTPPSFTPIVMPAGSYSIHLIVDTREIHNRRLNGAGARKERVSFADEMLQRGVPCEARALELGDAIWVARRKDGGGAMGDEVVLDFVVERKRLDDLITSITDGRWKEQKFRLSSSGLSQVTYVIEDWDVSTVMASWSKQVRTAVCNVQVIDGFFLERTRSAQDSLDYYARMHKVIVEAHQLMDLHVLPDGVLSRPTYLRLQTHLRRTRPSTPFLTTYDGYQALNSKSGSTVLRDVWARMLLCLRGMSPEKVGELLRVYQTPRALWDAYLDAEQAAKASGLAVRPVVGAAAALAASEESQGSANGAKGKRPKEPEHAAKALLFRNVNPVEQRRKIGSALSDAVWKVFCAEGYR